MVLDLIIQKLKVNGSIGAKTGWLKMDFSEIDLQAAPFIQAVVG